MSVIAIEIRTTNLPLLIQPTGAKAVNNRDERTGFSIWAVAVRAVAVARGGVGQFLHLDEDWIVRVVPAMRAFR